MRLFYLYKQAWVVVGLLLAVLLSGSQPARAQSGPYGNEWIVPGQQYVKIKIWRDGIYRLDNAYLTKTGLPIADPGRLQLWRRGREVAVHLGGNASTLDATTYLEFFGQRNNGQLDAEYYKNPIEQPHQLYSFDTDTAAYFLTYGTQAGRRMAEPTGIAGTLHPYRLVSSLKLHTEGFGEVYSEQQMPWLQGGEGFMGLPYSGYTSKEPLDSLFRAILPSPAPRLEAVFSSGKVNEHQIRAVVVPPSGPERELGVFSFSGLEPGRFRTTLQKSDFTTKGNITLLFGIPPGSVPKDIFRVTYYRIIAAQANRWYANRRTLRFQNDSTLAGPAAFELDSIPASVVGYDVQDPWNVQRVAGTPGEGLLRRYVFPSASNQQTRQLLLTDLARPLVPSLPARPVTFRTIDPARPDFVIITHQQLMKAVGDVPNAAREYANYRASVAGGRHDTLMVTASQVYDQFHYGERSVLALRHFALWLADNKPVAQTKYLLLLGKAIGPNEPVGSGSRFQDLRTPSLTRILGESGLDLVPVSTRSASDNFLSADWPHDNYVARLPTGRVIAVTPQDVMAYLNKLREYELANRNLDEWHKWALNLVGGDTEDDYKQFGAYLEAYKKRIEHPYFGGKVIRTFNRRDYPQGFPIDIDATKEINDGLSLVTYFGHSSGSTFNLNFGHLTDPLKNYHNRGKYPLMFYNGCDAARLFVKTTPESPTFGEEWLLTPDRGAMALMGQTGYSYPYELDIAQDTLYKLMLNDPNWYGKPVAATYGEAVRRLQLDGDFMGAGGAIATEQLLCTVWHGDPALALFSPRQPDFIASDAKLSIQPVAGHAGPVGASTKNFILSIGVTNPGKVTYDSLEVEVTRKLVNGTTIKSYQTFRQAFRRDTTYAFALKNEGNVFGQNVFEVRLDYRNKVAELSETNNFAQTTYTFLKGGITVLSPPEFAIVPTATPLLVAQTNDAAGLSRSYEFELDTVPTFNSLRLQHTSVGTLTADWQPTLPSTGRDSVVWYWRVRFATPGPDPAEDNSWVVSSFRSIKDSPGGWSQSHYGQFRRDERRGVEVSAPTGRWLFAQQKYGLRLRTLGGGSIVKQAPPTFNPDGRFGITLDPNTLPYVANCAIKAPGLLVAVYDQHTLKPVTVPGANYLTCGQGSQQYYVFGANPANAADTLNNLNYSAARQAELVTLLANVPEGAYVAVISMNRVRFAALPSAVRNALTMNLGSRLIAENRLLNGDPFALLAQKQASGGRLIQEVGPDMTTGALPRATQIVSISDTLRTGGSSGTIVSTRIGPAQQWGTLYNTIRTETPTGSHTLRLLGIDDLGHATVLNANVASSTLDVSTISAVQYPYLQLELDLLDAENRVPPQLKQWLVTYSGVPEGVVRRDLAPATAYDVALLTKQATETGWLRFPVVFQNISGLPFGAPLKARVSLRNEAGEEVTYAFSTITTVLKPGETVTFPIELNVKGVFGQLTAQVEVNPLFKNPNPQPELYHFNNLLTLPTITVLDRNVPPLLDVAFDGRRILSGELVSPTPVISIQLRDEDRLRHINDTRYFTVLLQRPGQATAEPINLNGSDITFRADSTSRPGTTATLEFQPGRNAPLANGTYTLRVQGRDPSQAAAGAQDYIVKFEVVRESTITNVFPYPNPVTSKARFVFTVTGQELPRNMRIQIVTLTGKLVREIFMQELGPLHIGNNLTDFAWDGTDQYGDRLANGTYLYRVSLDDAAGTFKQRATAGDKAFKNDWGKLVLLR